ncbi:Uncharacterised protein [Mycobacteroides abscessus subsp. abscessus]|nr:Uncharacterised protein [Mycobacteroides abscessus subsp. abscessus]
MSCDDFGAALESICVPVGISPQVTDVWAASSFVDEQAARISAGAMASAAARRSGRVCGGRRIPFERRAARSGSCECG